MAKEKVTFSSVYIDGVPSNTFGTSRNNLNGIFDLAIIKAYENKDDALAKALRNEQINISLCFDRVLDAICDLQD